MLFPILPNPHTPYTLRDIYLHGVFSKRRLLHDVPSGQSLELLALSLSSFPQPPPASPPPGVLVG